MSYIKIQDVEIHKIEILSSRWCQYVGYLYYKYLKEYKFNVNMVVDPSSDYKYKDDTFYIIISGFNKQYPKYYLLVQLEQLEDSNFYKLNSYRKSLDNAIEILDYSLPNIKFLENEKFNNVYYVPISYTNHPYSINTEKYTNKIYDIVYYGSSTDRRRSILDKLSKEGFNITNLKGFYGDRLINKLLSSKILINIHAFNENNLLETTRLCEALSSKSVVILSENSKDINNYPYISQYIEIFNNIDELKLLIEKYQDEKVLNSKIESYSNMDNDLFKSNLKYYLDNSKLIEFILR